ncbi:MAG: HAD family hydrolase [Verrucomicrobia bacterium]|nr:HAD family hydrolase [Verrucomicrobiota bacterium]
MHDSDRDRALPRLKARTIFFDIDETITTQAPNPRGGDVMKSLVSVVARANGLDTAAAEKKVRAAFDPERETVDRHYNALGITERQLWDALMEWLPQQIVGFPDAIEAIKTLHARGFRLFTCTTNSRLICRAKLHALGLADYGGSRYFTGMLGGAEVHPRGKTTPGFYRNLLKLSGAQPREVVHVGDSPQADLALAKQAGITQVVLPRRTQQEDWVLETDGGIYARSLEILPAMIAHDGAIPKS